MKLDGAEGADGAEGGGGGGGAEEGEAILSKVVASIFNTLLSVVGENGW